MPFFPQFSNLFVSPYIPPAAATPYAHYMADVGVSHEYDNENGYEKVTEWLDQSGNNRTLELTSFPPEYVADEFGSGLPAIRFSDQYTDGQYFELADDNTTIKSIIAVVKTETFSEYNCVVEAYGGGLYTRLGSIDVENAWGSYWANSIVYSQIFTYDKFILGVRTNDGYTTTGYQNGSSYEESGNGFQPRSKITIGNDATHSQVLYGKLAELILYDVEISDTQMQSQIAGLNAKWGVF